MSKLLTAFLQRKRPDPPWPRRIVRDIAHLFIPFAFAAFLLLLGGALLITWGRLSNAVLVGFCVTAGILIGLFIICHLALYCTWAKEQVEIKNNSGSSSLPHGSVPDAVSVKFGSPRVCRNCLGGLSVHVPAVATFGGTTGRLEMQPVVEDASEGEPVRPARAEQRPQNPQQTQLEQNNGHNDGGPEPSLPAGQTERESQDTAEQELRIRFSRPMSHLSATVSPLNLSQAQRSSARSFYAFQHPASPSADPRGGPGILIPSRPEEVNNPGLCISSIPPALRNNSAPVRSTSSNSAPVRSTSSNPERYARSNNYPRRKILQARAASQAQSPPPPPRTPPNTARDRTQQTAPKVGSPLRQTHRYPFSPREVGSPPPSPPDRARPHGPRESEQLSRIPAGDLTQRRAHVGPATSRQSHRAMSGHYARMQATLRHFQPPINDETHVVRFRAPDLAELIARGVIKVNPASRPPAWMLLGCAPGLSSSPPPLPDVGGVAIWDNAERRTVELRHSSESAKRNRSCKARVESVGGTTFGDRRYFSTDSGYHTASSGLLSGSTVGLAGRKWEEERVQYKEPALSPAWNQASSNSKSLDGERRVLRRRSSAPELSSRFRMQGEDEPDVDDEGSQGSESFLGEDAWDEMGPLGIVAQVVETGRRIDRRSVSSIDIGENEDII